VDDKKMDGWMEKNMDDWMIAFGKDDSFREWDEFLWNG
jgi:hypothetical protein